MPYLTIDGSRLAYDREGSGGPIVLLHGAAQDGTVWRGVTEVLRSRYDVVCLDLPGHGKSSLWQGRPLDSVEALAEATGAFLERLGLVRPVLVGHSLGGAVALRVASLSQDSLSAVVNIAGAAESASARIAYAGDLLELVAANPTDWMETNFFSLFGRHVRPDDRWVMSYDCRKTAPEVVMADLRAYTTCDFAPALADIRMPVLSVAGEDDWSCAPERVRATQQRVATGGEYVELAEVGHLPHLETPDRLAALIADFIERLS